MSKRVYDLKNDEELKAAYWQAAKGGVSGAARYGAVAGLLGLAAYFYSPVYRGLTVQFKVFLQLSAMTLGGIIEADRSLIAHERMMRVHNRRKHDAAILRSYEEDFGSQGVQMPSRRPQVIAEEGQKRDQWTQQASLDRSSK